MRGSTVLRLTLQLVFPAFSDPNTARAHTHTRTFFLYLSLTYTHIVAEDGCPFLTFIGNFRQFSAILNKKNMNTMVNYEQFSTNNS